MNDSIFLKSEDELFELYKNGTHFLAEYLVTSERGLKKAAWDIAIGQSIGNPNVRNNWETDTLFEDHGAKVYVFEPSATKGVVRVAYPRVNIDFETDGVSHLVCILMGGQMDIDHIIGCQLVDILLPEEWYRSPKIGLSGLRELSGRHDTPLLGGIVKPKTGLRPKELFGLVKEMIDGGCNFIKEDEILSNPAFCPIEERVPMIMDYARKHNVIYAVSINADPAYILDRVRLVHELGGNSIHVNLWSGLGVYKSIRDLDLPIFIHYQRSGHNVIASMQAPYAISWSVMLELAALCGVDSVHTGMWAGYLSDEPIMLESWMRRLQSRNIAPALSCGMNVENVQLIRERFGNDFMANVGGALHGHPEGTQCGTRAMKQAIDKEDGSCYRMALDQLRNK